MAEFCVCGSLIIDGRCSNKSCSSRGQDKQAPVKAASSKRTVKTEKAPAKSTRSKRASKCITYNLYETKSEEGNNS